MRDLAKTIERNGGDIWTRSSVSAITMDGERATGVLVERGGETCEVSAKLVVSNAGPHQTVRMIGREHMGGDFLDALDERVESMSSISVHLLSDRNLLADISGAVYTAIGARRIAMIFDASQTAAWAQDGLHVTEIYPLTATDATADVDFDAQIEEIRQDLDEMSPGWRDHAEMRVITLQSEYPGLRAWPGKGTSVDTPVPNVFLVGDGCESRGFAGGAAAASSAQRAADLIVERFPLR
jgi:phytoene dehydrogenase-like protein